MSAAPRPAAPDPALVERFRADFEALSVDPGLLALAVSGGPDSMAMLALAHAAFPGRIIAATVDHGLRPEATDEAEMVARHCLSLGIAHATLAVDAPITGASIQAQARAARYAKLLSWARDAGAVAILTAHHADDQAETFLMRAARGSGISGLAAIREGREAGGSLLLLRPLLNWRRHELRAVAEAAGIPFFDDPSNRSDTHDRTRFRALLENNPWLDVAAIARAAHHLAESERALIASADMLWDDRATVERDALVLDLRDLPRELRRRLTRMAIGHVRHAARITAPEWSDAVNIEPLLDALEAGKGATQAGVMVQPRRGRWHFRQAPPRRSH